MDMAQNQRYSRQLIIPGWDQANQTRLEQAHIGIIGTGGLGSPVTMYLCAAGIGELTICDYQEVELSNLNRQILYTTNDIGTSKVMTARNRLKALNPEITINTIAEPVDSKNIKTRLSRCDLLIDCLDNFETRLLLNRFSWNHKIPLLHGGISQYYGQIYLSIPDKTPCLACLLPANIPEDTGPVPVTGPVAGVVGSLQAIEALKYIGQMIDVEAGVLRLIDLVTMQIDSILLKRKRTCEICK